LNVVTRFSAALLIAFAFSSAPSTAQEWQGRLDLAREAARADRNKESARLFEAILRSHPAARDEVLREYADQLIYSGRPEAAVPLLQEVLARPDIDSGERRSAQRSLALAYAWSDQQRHAIAAYDALLAEDPADEAARIGRARSLQWLGRSDLALAALDSPVALGSGEASDIRSAVGRAARPLTEISGQVGQHRRRIGGRRFDVGVTGWRLAHRIAVGSGTAEIQPFYERITYDPDDSASATTATPGVRVRSRIGNGVELGGQLALQQQQFDRGNRSIMTGEASLALLPSDAVRVDLVAARRTFDDVRSIENGISADHLFASADFRPSPLWRITGRGEFADFSDGNRRYWGQAEVERRLSRQPNIFAGARATRFEFSKLLDNGYFNPKSFQSAELTARGWSQIAKKTWLDISAAAGVEDVNPGETKLAYSGRARLSHELTDRLELSATLESFSTRVRTAGDYERRNLAIGLGYRW